MADWDFVCIGELEDVPGEAVDERGVGGGVVLAGTAEVLVPPEHGQVVMFGDVHLESDLCCPSGGFGLRGDIGDQLGQCHQAEFARLGRTLGLAGKPGIEVLLHRPEIFQVSEEETDSRPGVQLAFTAITRALKALETDRKREGKALRADFIARINTITEAVPKIERLAEASRSEIVANFQTRLHDLIADIAVNEKRLYEEASDAAQRADITEEVTRLRVHLHGLRELVEREGTVGKQIEFLLQEVNREINTMGAKSQSAALSRITVGLKGEVEKMREQVQNVE